MPEIAETHSSGWITGLRQPYLTPAEKIRRPSAPTVEACNGRGVNPRS